MANFKVSQINDAFEMDEISLKTPKTSYNLATPKDIEKIVKSYTKLTSKGLIIISILFTINLLNYMDRYTVAGVLTEIQTYFKIDDSYGGLLQTAFIVFFMLFAPLSGYLGDRYNRKIIMLIGLSVWVAAVMASSFVHNEGFWIFLFLRGIVGIGEASYSTVAPTIIADLFASQLRSNVLMIFYFAIPVGSGLGYMVGSYVAAALGDWKWGMRVTPVLGLISVICMLIFIEEPERGLAEQITTLTEKTLKDVKKTNSYLADLKYLCKIKSYLWSIVGYTAVVFVTGTLAWWAPAAINHALAANSHLNSTDLLSNDAKKSSSITFGGITLAGGILGVSAGTYFSQAWKNGKLCFSANKRADALISAIGSFLAVPMLFAGFHFVINNLLIAWIAIFFALISICLNWAIIMDMLMYIIIPHRRNVANSWLIMLSHLFGDASGPYIIGKISDLLRGDDKTPLANYLSLVRAFYVPNLLLILSGIAFLLCAWTLPEDIRRFNIEIGNVAEFEKRKMKH